MELLAVAAVVPLAAGVLASALPVVASWLAELRVAPVFTGIAGYATLANLTAVAASAALAFLLLARVVAGTDR